MVGSPSGQQRDGGGALAVVEALAARLPDLVALVGPDRIVRWVNHVAEPLGHAGFVGASIETLVGPEHREAVVAAIDAVFRDRRSQRLELWVDEGPLPTGLYQTQLVVAPPEGDEPRLLAITSFVPRRRLEGLQGLDGARSVRRILQALPQFVFEVDAELHLVFANRPEALALARRVVDDEGEPGIDASVRSELRAKLRRVFDEGGSVTWRATIDARTFLVRAMRFHGDHALVVAEDLTPELEVKRRLELSEERLELALGTGRVELWELDVERNTITIVGASPDGLRVLFDAQPRQSLQSSVHPEDIERVRSAIQAHLDGLTPTYECEYRAQIDGRWEHRLDRGAVRVRADGTRVVSGSSVDVSALHQAEAERRALQKRLVHAERQQNVALLAGEVVHEFNNLLTVIVAGTERAARRVARGQTPVEEFEEVIAAGMRASARTRQLLAYGEPRSGVSEPVELRALVRSVAEMASRVFPRAITVELAPGPDLVVEGERSKLEQVIFNLAVNAREAMPLGGKLTFALEREPRFVVLSVTDTGVGIPDADRARLFEPFFTTKRHETSAGLGLTIAHGLVQQHGGTISVESTVGHGTTVRVRLPPPARPARARARPAPAAEVEAEAEASVATILVADDEALVRRTVQRTLARAGYRVILAVDGAEAVSIFEERGDEIDLVFLDVLMPVLDGWRARAEILRLAPGTRVLLTSGYVASAIPEGEGRQVPILTKPYPPEALLEAIRAALEAPPAD